MTLQAEEIAANAEALFARLRKREDEDRKCAANSQVIVDLLQPQMELFDLRDGAHPWNTYAVRMAVDHQNSAKRDRQYAQDIADVLALASALLDQGSKS